MSSICDFRADTSVRIRFVFRTQEQTGLWGHACGGESPDEHDVGCTWMGPEVAGGSGGIEGGGGAGAGADAEEGSDGAA